MRDMFQNHLLQLLSLTAMEPPAQMTANAVRDEKVKVLRSIRMLDPETIPDNAVRAQYTAGTIGEQSGAGLPRGAGRRADVDTSRRSPRCALRRQLALERRAVLPALRQAAWRSACRRSPCSFGTPPHLMFGAVEPGDAARTRS